MKKISFIFFILFVINTSFSQSSPTCAGANPICSGGVAPFPNTTGTASLGSPGCLGSAPNPAWFYFQIGTPGNLDILLHQGSNAPNYNNQDVDFICWGPFSSPQCTGLYDFPSTTIANNIVDCSYSANATETINVTNAQTGQYYMLLVTNFSNNPGFIQMDLLSSSTATTNCNIVCGVTLGVDLMLCNSSSTKTLTATFITAPTTSGTPTFQWFLNGVLQPALTTQSVTVNQAGTWKVITTRPGCTAPVSDEVVITNFPGLPINNNPPPITICTGASPAVYNLNSNIPAIMGSQSIGDYDYGFYLTAADALAGTNPIPSSQWSAYPGTVGQTIYFGAENFTDGTGCRGEVHFLLQQSPCTIVQPSNMVVCDDVSNDGIAVFDLTTQTATILGANNPANYTVSYHLTQAAANADTGAISPATAFSNTTNPQTIYVRSEETATPSNFATTSFELQVKPLPTATMSGTASICSGSSTNLTFSGTPGAVVTYSNGTANQTVTLDATGNGTVSVSPTSTTTYSLVSVATTATPSCSKILTGNVVVTVSTQVAGTLSYSPTSFCTTDSATYSPIFTVTSAGTGTCASTVPVYSSTPTGLTLNTTTGVITPSTSTPNTYTVTITYPACGSCAAVSFTTTVTIASPTTATLSYTTPLCTSTTTSVTPTLTGATGATTFTSTPAGLSINATTGAINPSLSAAGTYTITYVPTSTGVCAITPTPTTVTITAAPTASISYAGTPYCNNITSSQAITITGTNAYTGGTYSASPTGLTLDASTGAIVPSTSTPNTYTVTYTIPASSGCAAVDVTTTVTITGLPTASISYAGTPYCNNITSSQAITITGTNAFTGGTYSSSPTGLTLDAATGAIVPSTSTPNTYTVTYTIPASSGCAAVPVTTTVTITAAPTASISYAGTPYCNNITSSQAITITGTNAFTGGTYSASPTGLTIDAATGAIVPSTSTPNTYTVTYTIPASSGCAAVDVTTTVTITGLPTASISYAGTPYCNNITSSQAITITGTNAFTGGTYSSSPTGLTLDAATGAIVPSTSTPNTYTVTYTIPASAGCAAVDVTTTVTITAAPTASISYAGTPYCNNITSSQAITITGTNAFTGGTYSASPTGLTIDAATGAIVPSTSTPNTYTVTYTIPASSGCAAVDVTTTVTITGLPTASISYPGTPYCNNITSSQAITITGTNAFTGGTYSSSPTGLTLDAATGAIVPSTSTPNTYTVTYTIPASSGCAAVDVTTTVTITAAPTASISYAGTPYCNNITSSQAITITGTNAFTGGTYSASPTGLTIDAATGAIVPSTSTPNTYTVTYTIPASSGCAAVDVTTTVTITGLPTASISYAGTPYCNNITSSQAITITGTNAFTGGTYSSSPTGLTLDAATGAIVPSTSTPNTYTVTYTIPASSGCAAVPVTTTVTITSLPVASISVAPTTICSGSTSVVTFTGTPGAVVTYTVDGGANQTITLNTSGSATVTTPPLVNASVYTLVSVGNGCTVSLTNSVTINVLPLPTASISGSTICSNTTGTVTISGTPGAIVEYTVDGGSNQTAIISSSGTVILTTPLLTSNSVYQLVSVTSVTTPACVKPLSSSATVIVNPIPVVTASPVGETICSGTSTNISLISSVASTQLDWVVMSQVGVSGATNGSGSAIVQVLTATGITNGFVIYSITPTANGCVGSAITVQINVTPKPVASFVADMTYCNGETTSITLSSTIPGTTFTWNVASSNVNTSTVLPGSGASISQALNLINTLNVGSVTYTVLPFANNCYGDPVSIAIEVNPIPNVSLAIEDASICSGEMVHIDASSSIAGATFNWMIINQTGAVVTGPTTGTGSSIDQVITTTSPVASGTVTYQVTPVKNGCIGSSSTVTVTVHPRPEIFGVLPQQPICSGESTSIVLAASLPGTTFNWVVSNSQGVSGMSAGTGTSIIQVLTTTGSTQGSVTYAVTPMLNGCEGTMVEYTVLVNPLPLVSLEDGHVCVIQSTGVVYQTYLLETGVPSSGYTFDWYLDGVQLASSGPSHVATAPGVYEVHVRNTVTNCQAIATATVIPVYPATAFTTTVTEAFTNNATITVTVTQAGTGTLVYALDGGAWQSSNVFEGVEAGIHTVAVGDEEGCTYLETNVLVIDYMKYFTPNGDGYNDTWNIIGLNAQHNAKIYIFDRYGKLIKQLDPLGQGWDGTYNGQTLPSTDYWFTVDYTENQQQKQFKAHFALKR